MQLYRLVPMHVNEQMSLKLIDLIGILDQNFHLQIYTVLIVELDNGQ